VHSIITDKKQKIFILKQKCHSGKMLLLENDDGNSATIAKEKKN
jgi:hypothetical protein